MPLVDRHRRAAELSAKAIIPFIDTLSKTKAIYAKELSTLHETLDGPVGDGFKETEMFEIRTRLGGLPQPQRYARIIKEIERGNEAVVYAVTKTNDFLSDFLSDVERSEILKKWRASKFPEEHARMMQLEADSEKIERADKILQSYALSVANQSIVADGLPAMSNQHGAPGPVPENRSVHSMSLVERAKATSAAIAAQEARR